MTKRTEILEFVKWYKDYTSAEQSVKRNKAELEVLTDVEDYIIYNKCEETKRNKAIADKANIELNNMITRNGDLGILKKFLNYDALLELFTQTSDPFDMLSVTNDMRYDLITILNQSLFKLSNTNIVKQYNKIVDEDIVRDYVELIALYRELKEKYILEGVDYDRNDENLPVTHDDFIEMIAPELVNAGRRLNEMERRIPLLKEVMYYSEITANAGYQDAITLVPDAALNNKYLNIYIDMEKEKIKTMTLK